MEGERSVKDTCQGDIRQLLGELLGELRATRRDIKELKQESNERTKWERTVEQRLSAHEVEIQALKERSFRFKDAAPSLKITITAGGLLGTIALIIAALFNAGVHP